MIAPSTTSPALTSDWRARPARPITRATFRAAHNDLFQGRAIALFVREGLGIGRAAAIHDGDPYTHGLTAAFRDSFEDLGDELTTFTAVNKGETDMTAVLTEAAGGDPGVLFFPCSCRRAGLSSSRWEACPASTE